MEIIGIIIVILIVCAIPGIVEKYRQCIRDKAAHEAIDDSFNYKKEKADVLAINKKYCFKKIEDKKTALTIAIGNRNKDAWSDFVNSIKV